jgi:division protein CdvB (Snf7/Vps24/ESCRT-III family)
MPLLLQQTVCSMGAFPARTNPQNGRKTAREWLREGKRRVTVARRIESALAKMRRCRFRVKQSSRGLQEKPCDESGAISIG